MQTRQKRQELRALLNVALQSAKHDTRPDLSRTAPRKKPPKPRHIIAYDLETTSIAVGTPAPLYITAYGANFALEGEISSMGRLTSILRAQFLTEENLGVSFVAWNGNRFDAYFVAAALIYQTDLVIYPYMTKSKALRGMRIVRAEDRDNKRAKSWEFLCGIAMTGLVGVSLEKFVATFAPNFPKLTNVINFEREQFNPKNKLHTAYAMRDSEGLYHAMSRAQQIMMGTFGSPLGVTMGGACIKIFTAHIPEEITVNSLIPDLRGIVNQFVMRGGFCYCNKRYRGPVWKYDLNQAYAAAMRECALPCGEAIHNYGKSKYPIHIARITASNRDNKIPFYYRTMDINGRMKSKFGLHEIADTWLTSLEVEQLQSEGWSITIRECWGWPGEGFAMTDYVDRLERLRSTCEGGPGGAIGTMVKATGNHSYGKTVEQIEPLEYILAAECPDDAVPFFGDGADPIEHVYCRVDLDRKPKAYQQPHLGAWITARVRMVVRRAALVDPDAWLYADTDCVIFSRDVTSMLDIDPKRYGAWKIEEAGARYEIIAKKVYTEISADPKTKPKRSAKGLHVKKLSADDFTRWYEGTPPVQDQIQMQNFLSVMRGAEMFRKQRRNGTKIEGASPTDRVS